MEIFPGKMYFSIDNKSINKRRGKKHIILQYIEYKTDIYVGYGPMQSFCMSSIQTWNRILEEAKNIHFAWKAQHFISLFFHIQYS